VSASTEAAQRIRAGVRFSRHEAVIEAAENGTVILTGSPAEADRVAELLAGQNGVGVGSPEGAWSPALAGWLTGAKVVVLRFGNGGLTQAVADAIFEAGATRTRFVPCGRLADYDSRGLATAISNAPTREREPESARVTNLDEHRKHEPAEGTADWDELIPLGGTGRVGEFPVDSLPEVVRRMVEAAARSTAAPEAFAACVALGCLATLTARAVSVRAPGGWVAPANAYLACILPVGQGKSPTLRVFSRVLEEIEDQWKTAAWPAISEAQTRKDVADEVATKAKRDAAAGNGKATTEEAIHLAEEARSIVVPPEPRLVTKDSTPEGLIRVCSSNGGTLGIISDEGAEVFGAMSRYSGNGSANFGPYLAGHDGDRFVSDRVSRDSVHIPRLVLTLTLTIQPSVLEDLAKDKDNRERGFLARFLLCQPPSLVGYRSTDDPEIPSHVSAAWDGLLNRIAAQVHGREEPVVLTLTAEAEGAYKAWRTATEPRLRPYIGDLRGCVDWASKMQSHVVRLAAVLHCAGTGRIDGEIDLGTMADAIACVEFFASSARSIFASMSAPADAKLAVRLLAWIRRHERQSFKASEAWQALKGNAVQTMADIEGALAVLAEHRYVRLAPKPDQRGRGTAPSPAYLVNPAAHEEEGA